MLPSGLVVNIKLGFHVMTFYTVMKVNVLFLATPVCDVGAYSGYGQYTVTSVVQPDVNLD